MRLAYSQPLSKNTISDVADPLDPTPLSLNMHSLSKTARLYKSDDSKMTFNFEILNCERSLFT